MGLKSPAASLLRVRHRFSLTTPPHPITLALTSRFVSSLLTAHNAAHAKEPADVAR
jgi:hypothetical protein